MAEFSQNRFLRRIVSVVVIGLLAGLGAAFGIWSLTNASYGPREEIAVIVNEGQSWNGVAAELADAGLLKTPGHLTLRYRVLSRLGLSDSLRSGRYLFQGPVRPSELIATLTSPSGAQRVYTRLTIPPGLSSLAISQRVQERGLAQAQDVQKAIKDLAGEYPILPNDEGLQGYLMPDTYNIETPLESDENNSRTTARMIVRMMADTFFRTLDEVDPSWKGLTPAQLHEKITLASIVEREYRIAEEAPRIASVFINRIEQDIPLQSCATVVYVIENTDEGRPFLNNYLRYNRRIFETYLEIESPYNTYRRSDGGSGPGGLLPPGPIAVPGRVALEAAFYPAIGDDLFFVVKDPAAGTHTFSSSYNDHLEARASYLNQFVVKD